MTFLPTGELTPSDLLNGRYRIIKLVGQGGFAAVYIAEDTLHNQFVAVKEMSQSMLKTPQEEAKAINDFRREALMLRSLTHPILNT